MKDVIVRETAWLRPGNARRRTGKKKPRMAWLKQDLETM
jgi:hypothetical protein